MQHYFNVENLSIRFGGVKAVNNISFVVEKNMIYSIIGPNGSGKTTTFNIISGIYKPNNGSVFFKGKNLTGLRPDLIARAGVGRTFQNIQLFGNASVINNIMLGRHIHIKTGVLSEAFMWGRKSTVAKEET